MATLKIGAVATRSGVSIDTIRYYERVAVLPAAARRASGYREFDEDVVERIRLVKTLQTMGLTLDEIRAMVNALAHGGSGCTQGSAKIRTALTRTDAQIKTLQAMRSELRRALARCANGTCDLATRAGARGRRRSRL